jgi:DNA-binding NarL/FixJ family response regulator
VILELIAEGHTYEQILKLNEMLTYLDIFDAAREALDLDEHENQTDDQRLSDIRKSHPRAYETWTSEEEAKLSELFRSGTKTQHIAAELQRQQGAILSRLRRLGLVRS